MNTSVLFLISIKTRIDRLGSLPDWMHANQSSFCFGLLDRVQPCPPNTHHHSHSPPSPNGPRTHTLNHQMICSQEPATMATCCLANPQMGDMQGGDSGLQVLQSMVNTHHTCTHTRTHTLDITVSCFSKDKPSRQERPLPLLSSYLHCLLCFCTLCLLFTVLSVRLCPKAWRSSVKVSAGLTLWAVFEPSGQVQGHVFECV